MLFLYLHSNSEGVKKMLDDAICKQKIKHRILIGKNINKRERLETLEQLENNQPIT